MRRLILSFLLIAAPTLSAQSENRPCGVESCRLLSDRDVSRIVVRANSGERYGLVNDRLYAFTTGLAECYHVIDEFEGYGFVDFEIIDEGVLLFWSEDLQYRYDLDDREFFLDPHDGMLGFFLSWPIEEVSIIDQLTGCRFVEKKRSVPLVDSDDLSRPRLRDEVRIVETPEQSGSLDVARLRMVLRRVNSEPVRIPTLEELGIDSTVIRNYLERSLYLDVSKRLPEAYEEFIDHVIRSGWVSPFGEPEFFEQLPAILDTLSASTIRTALRPRQSGICFACRTITLQATNSRGVTLTISNFDGDNPIALPWRIDVDDRTMFSYDVDLMNLVLNLMPSPERARRERDPEAVLGGLAAYLYGQYFIDEYAPNESGETPFDDD